MVDSDIVDSYGGDDVGFPVSKDTLGESSKPKRGSFKLSRFFTSVDIERDRR